MTKKILLINDIPGYGKVAVSAMTPILVQKGFELFTLPTMIVSNTLNYGRFAAIDTTEYMKEAVRIWSELGFEFDAVSTGFIANDEQAEFIAEFCRQQADKGVKIFADPIMADNGKLYNSVGEYRVELMKKIISVADCIVPNITEACLLSGREYREEGCSESELYEIAVALHEKGAGSVLITSALVNEGGEKYKAVIGYDGQKDCCFSVRFEEIPVKINGSGDTFSAVVLGEVLEGMDLKSAAQKAALAVRELILRNMDAVGEYNGLPIEKDMDIFR